jgi:hypothetical protein
MALYFQFSLPQFWPRLPTFRVGVSLEKLGRDLLKSETLERYGLEQRDWSGKQSLLLQQAKEAWIADRKSWQPISDTAIALHFEC